MLEAICMQGANFPVKSAIKIFLCYAHFLWWLPYISAEQKPCSFLHNITNVSISEWNCYNVGNTITNAKVIGPGPRFEGSVGPEIPSRFQRL